LDLLLSSKSFLLSLRFPSAFSVSRWNCFSSLFLALLCSRSFLQFFSFLSECPWYCIFLLKVILTSLVESADPICQKHLFWNCYSVVTRFFKFYPVVCAINPYLPYLLFSSTNPLRNRYLLLL
jgi:hypothetical protein